MRSGFYAFLGMLVYAFELGGPRIELHNRREISMRFMCFVCALYPALCTAYAVI